MNLDLNFTQVFKILGVSFIGFFIVSVITCSYNLIYLEDYESITEFNAYASNSMTYLILGKLGEYITLVIASYMFSNAFNIKLEKALAISYLPNILLMISF